MLFTPRFAAKRLTRMHATQFHPRPCRTRV